MEHMHVALKRKKGEGELRRDAEGGETDARRVSLLRTERNDRLFGVITGQCERREGAAAAVRMRDAKKLL